MSSSDIYFEIAGNVFEEADLTPRQAAELAWAEVCRWVEKGYRPVIDVRSNDVTWTVDLEDPEDEGVEDLWG